MTTYILQDSDWNYADTEYPGILIEADSIEEAIKKATEQMVLEDPHDGGIAWKIAVIETSAFCMRDWADGVINDTDPVIYVKPKT